MTQRAPLALAAAGVVGLVLGYLYLEIMHLLFEWLWVEIPERLDSIALAAFTVVVLTGGAALVGWLRRRMNVYGHSPLDGLKVSPDPLHVSLTSLGAVVITLTAGAVLGPEAGLLALGTSIGTWFVGRLGSDESGHSQLVMAGVLGAVLALVVNLAHGGSMQLVSGHPPLQWSDLAGVAGASLVAAIVVALIRLAAYQWRRWADVSPAEVHRVTTTGLLVAVIALVPILVVGVAPHLVIGSGEGEINDLLDLAPATLLWIIAAKSIAYALCLGGGLRGGPIFPAMYIGAGVALVLADAVLPGNPEVLAAAGIMAGTTVGLALNLKVMLIIAAVMGLLLGSWLLIPATLAGLIIGRGVGLVLEQIPGVGPIADIAPTAAEKA